MKKRNHTIMFCAVTLFLAACGVVRTSAGQTVTIDQDIAFYLASGELQYLEVPEGFGDLLISDANWYASDGILIEDPVLKVNPTTIALQSGDKEYSAPGVRISIRVNAVIDEKIAVGKKGVYVEFPNIKLLSKMMEVQPKTAQGVLPDRVLVGQINVHSSESAAVAAKWISGIVTVIIILLVLSIGSSGSR